LSSKKIRVSIGMPVFNGEKYVRNAIDSIRNQTFSNFELIISDNASTDQTQEICCDYAATDSRIRYYRNEKNIGGPKNYNKVFDLSNSEYFKWAAYDDVLAPEFLRKCVGVLDNDTSLVGCYSKTGRIDENGNFLGYYNEGLLKNLNSPKPQLRFRDSIGLFYTTTPFHGVYRRSIFSKSQRHGSYIGADRNLVAELSLMGRIYEIPEVLFFWREHQKSYTTMFYGSERKDTVERLRAELTWWSSDNGTYFPHWVNCAEYFRSVNRVPLSLPQRFSCYAKIFEWIRDEGYHFMANDLILLLMERSLFARKILPAALSALKSPFRLR
jgi:glycosyltransferase involved in cell wall biosynthesis